MLTIKKINAICGGNYSFENGSAIINQKTLNDGSTVITPTTIENCRSKCKMHDKIFKYLDNKFGSLDDTLWYSMIQKFFIQLVIMLFVTNNCYAARLKPLKVGDSYGGGTIFCISDELKNINNCDPTIGATGYCGLIVADIDQANSETNKKAIWSNMDLTTGAQDENDGFANTQAIMAANPYDAQLELDGYYIAAWLCHNFRDPKGYKDWHLGAKNQNAKLRTFARNSNLIGRNCTGSKPGGIQCLIGGGHTNSYWSSTESSGARSASRAWVQKFEYNDLQMEFSKINNIGVRAIRIFDVHDFLSCSKTLEQRKELITERNKDIQQISDKSKSVKYINEILAKISSRLLTELE